MKKLKLFLAACAAMVGLGANAQSWTSPGSDPVNGGQYYILNVGAGQFVTAANDWGTQLSATGTDTGLLIKTQAVSNVTVGGASLSGWELLNTNNSNKLLFRVDERWGYTDKGTQDKGYVWNITKVNGVYRLQTAVGDPAFPAAATQYAGVNASLNGARVYFGYNSSSSDIDWMFLTEEQKSAANVVAKARLYRALMKAYAAGVNTDEASAVYENSASTAEELAAAVTNLNNACLQAHLDNASDSDPRDITEFVLSNSDFTQGNITGWETNYVSGQQANNIGYQDNNTYQSANGYVNRFIEAWRSGNAKIGDGYLRQTVSNMPEGKYVLECDAIATNQGNTSATTTGALLYINADGVDFTTSLSTAGSAVQHFSTEFLFTGEGDVIFGLKTQNTTANWIAADNFKVTYYGIDLSAYETQLAAAVAAFEALEGKVPSETYNTKKTEVLEVNNKEWDSSKEYSTAIAAIQTATSELNALAPGYAEYQAVRAAVLNTYNSTDVTSADASANSAATVEELNAAIAAVRTALKTAITANNLENVDLTAALLINPSFETGDLTGWENTGMSVQGNNSFGKVGTYYAECWVPDGTKSIAQTLSGMPAGVYKVTATIKARGVTSAELSAGGVSKAMTISDDQIRYTVEFACDADADITIKYEGVGTKADNSWLCADDFTLTYVGALPDVTAVEGKMNADVAATQTAAIAAYNAEKTVAKYNAAQSAIAAAQASITAYAVAATAIADANALKEAHNFATAEATTTFADAIAAVQAKYDEGMLTDAEATAGANLGTVATGWRAGANTAASNFLENGFSLNDFGTSLYINTWSNEGATDGSNFKIPFYEYWTEDAKTLAENKWSGTLDVENGLYSVSAWVRVRAKNEVAAADATGITMDINGGGEGDYAAVDVTAGEQIGTSQFQIATYTAQGLVKDGKLTLNFNVGADNNISWLSFKNVKYTKVRDLTAEEAAVVPTGVTLDKTEATLTVAEPTVTLTPTFEPENATNTVTWTSSDENVATVADGVVTAVAPGTATITVTSTLDENVKASCEVTVSFPESTVPETYFVNDGASRTVYTLGENLIKNGTFSYPNAVATWKTIGYTTDAVVSNFTITAEGGAVDNGAYLTTNAGGAGAVTTIRKSVAVEVGKKYYFSVYTNGKAPSSANLQYNALFKMSDATTETGTIKQFEWPQGAGQTATEWSKTECVFTAETPYVGVRMGWNASSSFDEFVLAEITDESIIGNVQYALDAIPTANIGTGAFQYSQDAVDAANALVQGTATVEDVTNAYNALTTVNPPADGQLFNVVLTYDGWTYDNKAMTYLANARTDHGNYNIQYKEAANTNLAQAFTFTKVEGNKYKMSQIDAAGVARYISTGVPYGGNTSQIRTTTNADDALAVEVVPTATDGKWNLRNTAANQYIGSQDAGVYTVNSHIDFKLVETSKPSITINTNAAGWGTTMLPFAVAEIPEGVKVYTCTGAEGATLTLNEVTALEANKPYIIEGAWNETLTGDAQGTALSYTEGLLTGVYAQTPALVGSYVLQKNDGKVGFYVVAEGKQPTVGANRAYVTSPAESEGVKAFYLGENDLPTAIQNVFDGLVDGDAYDLAGRKVQKLQKGGVYIINGKKVVVK